MMLKPFRLVPQPVTRVWGGHKIAEIFNRSEVASGLEPTRVEPIGEWWEVHGSLRIRDGEHQGKTLDQLLQTHGRELLGSLLDQEGVVDFPLLVKWLDCHDWLSVQIHPDDALARELTGQAGSRGKNECWYILKANPSAEIIHSLHKLPSSQELESIDGAQWLDWLNRTPVQPGQWWMTQAGIVHALGPGIQLLEIQQSSDLTYRLYDWDRLGLDGQPRPLHPAQAKRVLGQLLRELPKPRPNLRPPQLKQFEATECPYFRVQELIGDCLKFPPGQLLLVSALSSPLKLEWPQGVLELDPGETAIVPAATQLQRVGSAHPDQSWVMTECLRA